MRQKSIGIFPLGGINVEVFAVDDAEGGCFYFCPDEKSVPRMKVGIMGTWERAATVLLHEAFEFQMAISDHSFERSSPWVGGSDGKVFVMTHDQFSVVSEKVAHFMVQAIPEMALAWKRLRREWA